MDFAVSPCNLWILLNSTEDRQSNVVHVPHKCNKLDLESNVSSVEVACVIKHI